MTKSFKKGVGQPLEHGTWCSTDFDCKCHYPECEITLIDNDLMSGLENLADVLGKFRINCGFRCERHNKEVGGVSASQHVLGKAADISSLFSTVSEIARAAEMIPVFESGGVGIYSRFVHLDSRGHKARWGLGVSC